MFGAWNHSTQHHTIERKEKKKKQMKYEENTRTGICGIELMVERMILILMNGNEYSRKKRNNATQNQLLNFGQRIEKQHSKHKRAFTYGEQSNYLFLLQHSGNATKRAHRCAQTVASIKYTFSIMS